MVSINSILLVLKYIVTIGVLLCVVLAPAYIAAANKGSKYDCMRIRVASWFFGYSFIGWIFALFVSAKK